MAPDAAPTPAPPAESVVLRPRTTDDMTGLLALFTATRATTGYPVDPLPEVSTGATMAHFVGGAPALEVAAMVACGSGSSSAPPCPSSLSSLDRDNDHDGPGILGHASLRRVPPDATDARVWRQAHGHGGGEGNEKELWGLARLAVHPAAQGRGLGGRLLAWAEERARAEGRRLVLGVLEKDVGAMAVYERRGWRRYGQDAMVGHDGRWWVEYFYEFGGRTGDPVDL